MGKGEMLGDGTIAGTMQNVKRALLAVGDTAIGMRVDLLRHLGICWLVADLSSPVNGEQRRLMGLAAGY